MKKKQLYLIICFITFSMFSQTKFEKGYYITSNGVKIEGLIKNIDWRNNPTSIEFKKEENENSQEISFNDFNEFEIYNTNRYVKFEIKVDPSTYKTQTLDYVKEPKFINETVFLKVLVSGDYNLYRYENQNIIKFYFGKNNENVKPLIFTKYLASEALVDSLKQQNINIEENSVLNNERFKKQLFSEVNCDFKRETYKSLKYENSSLITYFVNYNKCNNSEFVEYKTKKSKINLKPSLKLNYNNFNLEYFKVKSDNSIAFGLGMEIEVILPFNNNKFGFVIDPNYNFINQELYSTNSTNVNNSLEVKFNYLNIPIGIRYYMYLNETSKIFITPSFDLNYSFGDSNGYYINDIKQFNFSPKSSFGFGLGYSYKKYFIESKIQTKTILFEPLTVNNDNNSFYNISLSFKYQLF